MGAERNQQGVIMNAAHLNVDEVVREKVLCPACHDKVFQVWPEGWDAHAAHQCAGVQGNSDTERKQDFKARFGHLFR
jgi:hypothetical protein